MSVVWRYLPRGRVLHALLDVDHAEALCGASVAEASEWRGTGPQAEYDRAATLRRCESCAWWPGGDPR